MPANEPSTGMSWEGLAGETGANTNKSTWRLGEGQQLCEWQPLPPQGLSCSLFNLSEQASSQAGDRTLHRHP
jgi:hypothetical protein